ncbi:hypothetical protein [Aureimonas fodinaquatilis]|nr:hypothetical protein [Aureimonas fodinaquatilis]
MDVLGTVSGSQMAALNGLAGLANISAEILDIIDAGVNDGASADYVVAASSGLAMQIMAGLLVAFAPASGGLITATMLSGINPKTLYYAAQFGEMAAAQTWKYRDTKWQGDLALASYFSNMQREFILRSMPIASLFSEFPHLGDDNGSSMRRLILEEYLPKTGSSKEKAINLFWSDGFDSREKEVQHEYVMLLRQMSSKVESKRVIAVTGQELRTDMAMVSALLGGAFANGVNSNRNYFYDSQKLTPNENGMIGRGLDGIAINLESSATEQYFLFLTPVMVTTDKERYETSVGKTTIYGTKLPETPHRMVITDGASATTADVRNFASSAAYAPVSKDQGLVSGVDGGLRMEMGPGNDIVIAGARAMFASGGDNFDGVDYRFAMSSFTAQSPGLRVNGILDPNRFAQEYQVNKSGYGTFHQVKLMETEIQEGKSRRVVITRTIETVRDVYSNSQQDLLHLVEWIYGTSHWDSMSGSNFDETLFGDGGDDILAGNNGNDQLLGGTGDDRIDGGQGYDLIFGDAGNDVLVDTGDDSRPAPVDPKKPHAPVHTGDTLIGGDGNDTIRAGAGDDVVFGDEASGKDASGRILQAGAGVVYNDVLSGEDGNDTIDGGFGSDTIDGGAGNDQIFGGAGSDVLRGGLGNDTIWGGDGHDTISGGDGEDALYGMDGDDTIQAGSGASVLIGGAGRDKLRGGLGHDVLSGGEGSDTLLGGSGNDILFDDGRDKNAPNELYGEDGDDILVATDATLYDLFDGGAGRDTLSMRFSTKGVDINLERRTADLLGGKTPSKDTVRSIEWVEGSEQDDILTGNTGDNRLIGRGGNDTLTGGSGKDMLFGGQGRDDLLGGAGSDIIDGGEGDDYIFARGGDTMFFDGAFGHDVVQAEDGGNLTDSLFIFTGIDYRNLYFVRQDNNLLIRREQTMHLVDKSEYMGTSGVLIVDYFAGTNADKVAFADQAGKALVGTSVELLTTAMASAVDASMDPYGYSEYMKPIWDQAWISMPAAA